MGDQCHMWDKYDGLHSALIGILNGGLSGFSMGHSDIGGYTTVAVKQIGLEWYRTKELLQRWIEMNIFSDAMIRSHPASDPDPNYQLYTDESIASFLKTFTENFVSLGDYRMGLMEEAHATGVPITRSLMMEFPKDKIARKIYDQFMLGSDIMVAPMLESGESKRKVYFPEAGVWQHMIVDDIVIDASAKSQL